MARESADNPNVIKAARELSEKDFAYCDLQGDIFMAALDLGYPVAEFAPVFMNSQLAGVIDYSFSASAGMENDRLSAWLQIPLLIKSPEKIAALVMWLDEVSEKITAEESASVSLLQLCEEEAAKEEDTDTKENQDDTEDGVKEPGEETSAVLENQTLEGLTAEYEYAYWLGYIYRCECLLHVESSRMVYGAFPEEFMRETYSQMMAGMGQYDIEATAQEICRRLDMLLSGKLWNEEKSTKTEKTEKSTKTEKTVKP